MKERSIKSIRHRVMSRLKGLGAMLLALFVALAAIPVMPAMEALAESGDNYYLVVSRPTEAAFFGKGHEMRTESGIVINVFEKIDNGNNRYFNSYPFGLKDGVDAIVKIADLKVDTSGQTVVTSGVVVPETGTVYVGCVREQSGSIITVKIDDEEMAESDRSFELGKAVFELPAGKYDVESIFAMTYPGPQYTRTINFKTIKEETGACSHDIQLFAAQEPTCTEDGYEEHYECTKCHKWFGDAAGQLELDDSEIARRKKKATGHKWNKGEVIQEATYDETGIKLYTCSRCGETREETIPKKTRSYDSDSSDSGDGGGSGGGRGGTVSTQSLDVNGNAIGGPDPNRQPDSGAPVSDRGGNWGNENLSWTYTKSDGNLAKSEWLNLEYNGHTYWYYFDDGAIMQTDWFNYNGATYYFVPEMDGWRGRMVTGWQQIGDKWYYFEPTVGQYQGQMYRGIMTPDGHVVGADGAWNGVGTPPVSTAATA